MRRLRSSASARNSGNLLRSTGMPARSITAGHGFSRSSREPDTRREREPLLRRYCIRGVGSPWKRDPEGRNAMSLFASLSNSSNALTAFDRALTVTQNNVTNASTPGYAVQRLNLNARPFDPTSGLDGGVEAGDVESSRNQFAEAAVGRAQTALSTVSQQSTSLTAVQNALNLSASNGIPATLGNFFQSFSAWSQDPVSQASRQAVVSSAQQVVDSFHTTVSNLQQAGQDTDRQISQTVDQINAY